jgi:hypothetical protein
MGLTMPNRFCNIPVVVKRKSLKYGFDMRQWLVENIEPDCYDAEDWIVIDNDPLKRRIWFMHEKDAVLFALKWQ